MDCPPPCGWSSWNPMRTWTKPKAEEEGICFLPHCWSGTPHCIFSSLALRLGFTPLSRPWFSGLQTQTEWYHWLSWVSTYRQHIEIMGLFNFHNPMSQFLRSNLYLSSICLLSYHLLVLFLFRILTNALTQTHTQHGNTHIHTFGILISSHLKNDLLFLKTSQ